MPRFGTAVLFLLLALLPAVAAERGVTGVIVPIPTSITTDSVARLRSSLHGPLKRFEQEAPGEGRQFVVLCDFNPEGRRSECDDFGACYSLASYLSRLPIETKGVLTIAYVHGEVRRHSVLPVLACREIVFSPQAKLGQVVAAGKTLPRSEITAYEEIVRNRRPVDVVRKMLVPSDEFGREGALYDFAQASKLGLCQPKAAATLDEARLDYRLPRAGSRKSLDRSLAWRIPIEGPITGETVEKTQRRVARALRARAAVIVFELRCVGGDSDKANELGRYIASINDDRPDDPVETIAYVTSVARNLAAFPAFGCSRIVMQRMSAGADPAPEDADDGLSGEARLGDFSMYLRQNANLERIIGDHLADLAAKNLYPAEVARALTRADLEVVAVEPAAGAGGRTFMTKEEYERDTKKWRVVKWVKPWDRQARFEGKPLTLSATQAQELEIASTVKDLADLYTAEGLESSQVKVAEADWLDGLADFLRDPWTSMILIMVAITCLMLELKMPGVGLPGVVAAICFVLFFWAHSQLHGQITWLAILLFALGLLLIGMEIFVMPGFGITGISGTLLVLASLGLVVYGHWPRSGPEWVGFGNKLAPFGVSLLGSLVGVILLVHYLPHIPVLNRLMLRPGVEPGEEEAEAEWPLHAELQGLIGAIGVAATPLRPAGKTQFGEAFVDVVAEGGYIMPGTRVRVIEVEGGRVVVKEV
jgi:membrane-bound serine protease (ClpP class)